MSLQTASEMTLTRDLEEVLHYIISLVEKGVRTFCALECSLLRCGCCVNEGPNACLHEMHDERADTASDGMECSVAWLRNVQLSG